MATMESKVIRQERAIKRIQQIFDANGLAVSLPVLHKDRHELHATQLELIANALDSLQLADAQNDTIAQLQAVVSKPRYTKAEIEAVLHAD